MSNFAYAFIVGYDEDGPYLDCFMDVSQALNVTADEFADVTAIQKRLGLDISQRERLATNFSGMTLRARVTGKTIHKVDTDEPLTADDLRLYLQYKQMDKTLKDFLTRSKI
jgi:hypothetical protein